MCFSNTGNLPWPNLPASESVDDFTVISMTRKFKDLYFYLLCIMEQCFQTRLREEEVTLGPVSLSQEKIWIISEEITRVIPDVTHLRLSTSQNDQPGSGPLCFAHSLADTENLKSILQKGLLLVWSLYLRARGGGGGLLMNHWSKNTQGLGGSVKAASPPIRPVFSPGLAKEKTCADACSCCKCGAVRKDMRRQTPQKSSGLPAEASPVGSYSMGGG